MSEERPLFCLRVGSCGFVQCCSFGRLAASNSVRLPFALLNYLHAYFSSALSCHPACCGICKFPLFCNHIVFESSDCNRFIRKSQWNEESYMYRSR